MTPGSTLAPRIVIVLLAGLLLFPNLLRAQTDAAAPVRPGANVLDVGKDAETVAAVLRQMRNSLADTATITAAEAMIDAHVRRTADEWTATSAILADNPRLMALDSLSSSWFALRADLADLNARIAARVQQRDADIQTLSRLHESWTQAVDLARKADAPPAVVDHVKATLADIDEMRPEIEQRRAQVLVVRDTISRSMQSCDDALARIDVVRHEAVARIGVRQEPPLWGRAMVGRAGQPSPHSLAADFAANADALRVYTQSYAIGLAVSGIIVLATMVLLRRGRSVLEASASGDAAFGGEASVFRTPYAAGFLIGLALSRPLRPYPPIPLQQLTVALAMVAAIFVLRPSIGTQLLHAVYAMGVLLLLNLAREMVQMPPRLDQTILAVEMAASAALLAWITTRLRIPATLPGGSARQRAWASALSALLAVGCGIAAIAGASGFVELANFLGVGLFYLAYVSFVLLAFWVAADGVLAVALVRGPLARVRAVSHHRSFVHRRARMVLGLLALWIWVIIALSRFELSETVAAGFRAALETRLQVGELDLPLGHLIGFAAVLAGAYLVTRLVGFLLEEDVYSRMNLPRGLPYALSSLTRYGLLLVGFLLALAVLGFDLTRITVLVSAFGVGLGFGLQHIINNFVSGLILLFERPVQVGDNVQLGDLDGTVLRIGLRASTLRTSQGAEVIVPNSKLIEERVTNWTLSDRSRRIEVDVSVPGGVEPEAVIALLVDVVRQDPRVSAAPPPEALLIRFGESSADFQVHVWTDEPQWTRLRSELGIALQRALRTLRTAPPSTNAEPDRAPNRR